MYNIIIYIAYKVREFDYILIVFHIRLGWSSCTKAFWGRVLDDSSAKFDIVKWITCWFSIKRFEIVNYYTEIADKEKLNLRAFLQVYNYVCFKLSTFDYTYTAFIRFSHTCCLF